MTLAAPLPDTELPEVTRDLTDAELSARYGLPDPTPEELAAALAMVE